MRTDCTAEQLSFQGIGGRQVVAAFDAGRITSDAGVLLLREVAERTGVLRRFAQCFRDYRDPLQYPREISPQPGTIFVPGRHL